MTNPPALLNLCPLCGVALGRSVDVEAHTRTQLCLSTRHTSALHADGYVRDPGDRDVAFLLVAAIPGAGRWAPTGLIPDDFFKSSAMGPYAERWWPAWAVELCAALVGAKLRKLARYPERLRLIAAREPEAVEAALTTLRSAGVEALDAFLFAPTSALTSSVPHE